MDKAFVTGATGFIGTLLVESLTRHRVAVRALCRRDPVPPPGYVGPPGGPLRHELVQIVRGDVTDQDSLARGMEGCSHVFHLAGYAKNWAPDPRTYWRVNADGVSNVLAAARCLPVRRIVVTSTVVTFGATPPGQIGDERMPRCFPSFTDYEQSKSDGEQIALAAAAQGIDVVIVNPTRVFGPGQLSEGNALAKMVDDYDQGRVPILLNAGRNVGNYVLVDDVVQGLVLAMERGRPGERYILGGDNVTLKEFFRAIDRISGKRHFQVPIFRPGALAFSWFQKKRAEWLGIYPTITPGWVRTFLVDWAFSVQKAEQELGYRHTPLEEGLRRTYEWLLRVREQKR